MSISTTPEATSAHATPTSAACWLAGVCRGSQGPRLTPAVARDRSAVMSISVDVKWDKSGLAALEPGPFRRAGRCGRSARPARPRYGTCAPRRASASALGRSRYAPRRCCRPLTGWSGYGGSRGRPGQKAVGILNWKVDVEAELTGSLLRSSQRGRAVLLAGECLVLPERLEDHPSHLAWWWIGARVVAVREHRHEADARKCVCDVHALSRRNQLNLFHHPRVERHGVSFEAVSKAITAGRLRDADRANPVQVASEFRIQREDPTAHGWWRWSPDRAWSRQVTERPCDCRGQY